MNKTIQKSGNTKQQWQQNRLSTIGNQKWEKEDRNKEFDRYRYTFTSEWSW